MEDCCILAEEGSAAEDACCRWTAADAGAFALFVLLAVAARAVCRAALREPRAGPAGREWVVVRTGVALL